MVLYLELCNSYTMVYPPIRRDNPRALNSECIVLAHVQVNNYGITILKHKRNVRFSRYCIFRSS